MRPNLLVPAVVIACVAAAGCQQQAPATGFAYADEGRPYARELLRAVSREWKADWLLKMADPRMLAIAPEPRIREMLDGLAKGCGLARPQEMVSMNVGVETGVFGFVATYIFRLECEKELAHVVIKMQKTDGHWKVLGFWVKRAPPAR